MNIFEMKKLNIIDGKLDKLIDLVVGHESRFEKIDSELDYIHQRIDQVLEYISQHDRRLGALERIVFLVKQIFADFSRD